MLDRGGDGRPKPARTLDMELIIGTIAIVAVSS